ncbi:MAG: DnaJ domain-containing protein [Sedimentisphaerales bacterium]|nr:DnaJ domain-containing protein [Sedimentisphaerales bacterium]
MDKLSVLHAACQILEVGEGTSQAELKKAYRRACSKYHPDHNRENSDVNNNIAF